MSISEFSPLRSILWPIHRYELKKFLPMICMIFFISINYHLLRILKDTLVITGDPAGVESIPFLKVWAMLPTAFFMAYLFTLLSRHLSRDKVFYSMFAFFLGFFALFTFVLYPMRHEIQPYELAASIQSQLPAGLKGLVSVFKNWTISSFYVMSEMWSAMILSVLFWSFVNQITRVTEAKRFYGLIAIGTNVAGFFTGQLSAYWSTSHSPELSHTAQFEQLLNYSTYLLLFSGVMAMLLFNWMIRNVLTDPLSYDPKEEAESIAKQKNISLLTSIRYLRDSRYALYVAAIVVSYNIVINLTEVTWKFQVSNAFPNPVEFNAYFSKVTSYTGLLATFSAFLSGYMIRRFGWTPTAMITPLILLVTSIGFFFFLLFDNALAASIVTLLGTTPLLVSLFFGSLQNVLSRASKYSLFDATKELALNPLPPDEKINAKAIIDGVGSRLGKSGSSIIYQLLLLQLSSMSATVPYVAALIVLFIAIWMVTVKLLGRKVNALTQKKEDANNLQEVLVHAEAKY